MELTKAERLILFMLCEIHEHLKIKDGIDAKFIQDAIGSGNAWSIVCQYSGIFEAKEKDEETVTEVNNILDMWSFIERGHSDLSPADKEQVKTEAKPFTPRFRGFDGNNETEQLSISGFLIGKLGRFSDFKDRDLNSHRPSLDGHRRMLRMFEKLRPTLADSPLSASQIIELLNLQRHSDQLTAGG